MDMQIIAKAKTTKESFAKEHTHAAGGCDHIKCKLCEY